MLELLAHRMRPGKTVYSIRYRGSYMSDHLISNLLNKPLASLINLI